MQEQLITFPLSLAGTFVCTVCVHPVCVCVFNTMLGRCHNPVFGAELYWSHCVLGKAIGRPGMVIKVKLLSPHCSWLPSGTIGEEALCLSCFTPTLPSSSPNFILTAL